MRAVLNSTIFFLFFCCSTVSAGWNFLSGITVAEIYTDNIDLTSSENKDFEYATEVKPSIAISNKSAKLDAEIDYSIQGILFARESSRNTSYQQLSSDATFKIVPKTFEFDLGADISQQVVDRTKPVGFTAISSFNNVEDVTTFYAGPRYQFKLGSSISGLISYNQQYLDYEENRKIDSVTANSIVRLNGKSTTDKFRWKLQGDSKTVSYKRNLEDEKISKTDLEINYKLSSRWWFDGSAGYEDNELNNVLTDQKTYGKTWSAGLTWNPTVRTSISASTGEQFYGSSESYSISQRTKRLTLALGKTRSLQSLQTLQFSSTDETGIVNPGSQLNLPEDNATYLSERYFFNASYVFPKSNLNFRYSKEDRIFDNAGSVEKNNSGSLVYKISMGSRTTLSTSFYTNETEEIDGTVDRLRQLDVTGSKSFSKKLSSGISLSRLIRDGDLPHYNANMLRMDVSFVF